MCRTHAHTLCMERSWLNTLHPPTSLPRCGGVGAACFRSQQCDSSKHWATLSLPASAVAGILLLFEGQRSHYEPAGTCLTIFLSFCMLSECNRQNWTHSTNIQVTISLVGCCIMTLKQAYLCIFMGTTTGINIPFPPRLCWFSFWA